MRRTGALLLLFLLTPSAAAANEGALEGTVRLWDGTLPRQAIVHVAYAVDLGIPRSWVVNVSADGTYRAPVPPGEYWIAALDIDPAPATLSTAHLQRCSPGGPECQHVRANETTWWNATLPPAGAVVGFLRDEAGAPIAGAQVSLREPGVEDVVAGWNETNATGLFRIVVPDGRYELVAGRFPDGARPFLRPNACAPGVACVRPIMNDTLWVNLTARVGVVVQGRLDAPGETQQLTLSFAAADGAELTASVRDRSIYRLHVPVGAYALTLRRDDGSAAWPFPCDAATPRCVSVAADRTLDLVLAGGELREAGGAAPPPREPPVAPPIAPPSVTVPGVAPLLAALAAVLVQSSMRARKRQGR